ncbi:TPA: hypothetical protein MH622_29830, partial [Klebsiella pneumoniae]|nr:hypothetical protein [Klebsiella pneumoniae]
CQFFQQGTVQRFLFGKALFQQKDVVRRDVIHKPAFYQAYSATTRIKKPTAWSGRSARGRLRERAKSYAKALANDILR